MKEESERKPKASERRKERRKWDQWEKKREEMRENTEREVLKNVFYVYLHTTMSYYW